MYYEVQSLIINVIKEKRFVWIFPFTLECVSICAYVYTTQSTVLHRDDCEQSFFYMMCVHLLYADNNKKKYFLLCFSAYFFIFHFQWLLSEYWKSRKFDLLGMLQNILINEDQKNPLFQSFSIL